MLHVARNNPYKDIHALEMKVMQLPPDEENQSVFPTEVEYLLPDQPQLLPYFIQAKGRSMVRPIIAKAYAVFASMISG